MSNITGDELQRRSRLHHCKTIALMVAFSRPCGPPAKFTFFRFQLSYFFFICSGREAALWNSLGGLSLAKKQITSFFMIMCKNGDKGGELCKSADWFSLEGL